MNSAGAAPPSWASDVATSLATCHRLDERIHAWAYLSNPDDLTRTPLMSGPLAGVAFGVKDLIDVAHMPTRAGSAAFGAEPRALDASCVMQLRQAGAVPIGKTVTAELAYVTPGPTRNPHNLAHTPGGSSSGSAAAVAAGMVDLALGTQTGGSIIRPAAFCGVVGFKPSFGRVSREGMLVNCESLDTIGWFTQTIEQSSAVARIFFGSAPPSLHGRPAPRVALLPCRSLTSLNPAVSAALEECTTDLRDAGAEIIEPDCSSELERLLYLHGEIMHAEMARSLHALARASGGHLSARMLAAIQRGLAIAYSDYVAYQREREQLALTFEDAFADIDFILAPSAPSEAPAGLETTGSSVLNRVWSLLGWPCVHLPTGTASNNLPVGVQCVGLPQRDLALLDWAGWLEAQRARMKNTKLR